MTSFEQPVDPHISIVIPIYNEQGILHSAVVDLRERLKPFGIDIPMFEHPKFAGLV